MLRYLLVVCCLMLSPVVQAMDRLTEEVLRSQYRAMSDAANRLDFESLLSNYSDDARLELAMPEEFGGIELKLTLVEYRVWLYAFGKQYQDYDFDGEILDIQISEDGQSAVVATAWIETFTMDGVRMSGRSEGVVHIKLLDGKALATYVRAVSFLDKRQGA